MMCSTSRSTRSISPFTTYIPQCGTQSTEKDVTHDATKNGESRAALQQIVWGHLEHNGESTAVRNFFLHVPTPSVRVFNRSMGLCIAFFFTPLILDCGLDLDRRRRTVPRPREFLWGSYFVRHEACRGLKIRSLLRKHREWYRTVAVRTLSLYSHSFIFHMPFDLFIIELPFIL